MSECVSIVETASTDTVFRHRLFVVFDGSPFCLMFGNGVWAVRYNAAWASIMARRNDYMVRVHRAYPPATAHVHRADAIRVRSCYPSATVQSYAGYEALT
eukprot:2943869-Rhodomonas_salina.2